MEAIRSRVDFNSKKEVKTTKILNRKFVLKGEDEVLDERRVGAGNDDIVNINKDDK